MHQKSIKQILRAAGLCAALSIALVAGGVRADTFTLAIQPILPAQETESHYAPLAAYLSEKTGHTIQLTAEPNFVSYWQEMRSGKYDFVLDAAHFTDFRVRQLNYRVIAKVLDVVSFTLVTGEDTLAFEPDELVGKRVASLAAPSRGAITLDGFFDSASLMRRPVLVEAANAQDAITKVLDRKADGAIVPTPLIAGNPQLNVIVTQEQWPHMGFSAAPDVSDEVVTSMQIALVGALANEDGQQMLQQINFPGFERANEQTYAGYADVLKGFWGADAGVGGDSAVAN